MNPIVTRSASWELNQQQCMLVQVQFILAKHSQDIFICPYTIPMMFLNCAAFVGAICIMLSHNVDMYRGTFIMRLASIRTIRSIIAHLNW